MFSESQMEGTITRIHSNYYYVECNSRLWECMLRNKIKKSGIDPKVGDKVIIEEKKDDTTTAVITEVLKRQNELKKPNISNIDQIVIIMSTYDPDFNPLVLDKFIVLSEAHNIFPVICINKSDKIDEKLKSFILKTYEKTGYKFIFTSAKENFGLEDLKEVLINKTSVFTGVSGSGKSSLLNTIDNTLKLQTGEVSKNLGTGKHTTRHVSLQKFFYKDSFGFVADTPGFSFIEFNYIDSHELAWYFKEFKEFIPKCKMSKCVHFHEPDCGIKNNIDLESSRYASYITILNDILELEKVKKVRSSKKENKVKISQRADGKNISVVKMGTQVRDGSRRTRNQELSKIQTFNDIEDQDEI